MLLDSRPRLSAAETSCATGSDTSAWLESSRRTSLRAKEAACEHDARVRGQLLGHCLLHSAGNEVTFLGLLEEGEDLFDISEGHALIANASGARSPPDVDL